MGNCQFFTLKTPQPTAIDNSIKNTASYSLIIKSVTWKKESYGLFDYENKNTTSTLLKTTQSGLVKKLGDDILLFNDLKFLENDESQTKEILTKKATPSNMPNIIEEKPDIAASTTLVSISIKNSMFWIHNSNNKFSSRMSTFDKPLRIFNNESLTATQRLKYQKSQIENANSYKHIMENGPWMVVRYFNENQGFKIFPNDFIKLGRIAFKVRDVFLNNQHIINKISPPKILRKSTSLLLDKQTLTDHEDNNEEEEANIIKQCRICLSDSNSTPCNSLKNCGDIEKAKAYSEGENPFINPCKCSGTMKYIHVNCLQFWLASKIQLKQTSDCCKSLSWKNIDCELLVLSHNKKEYELIKIPKPEGSSNYIILDILCKESNQTKGIHIIDLESKDLFKIGRGNENDLKISDISVSRTHAIIKRKNHELYIEDSNSKFGTLVLMRKAYPLNDPTQMTAIQSGRIVLYFNLCQNSVSGFDLCCKKVCKKNEISHKIDEELLSQDELVFNERKKKNSELEEQEEIKNSQLEPEISDNRSNEGDVEESISGIANLELNESNQNNINNNNETHHNVSHVNNE